MRIWIWQSAFCIFNDLHLGHGQSNNQAALQKCNLMTYLILGAPKALLIQSTLVPINTT